MYDISITFQSVAFIVFSVLTLGGALGVVSGNNLIHNALFLIVSLFGVAGLFVLLAAPFLAAIQVLVYIGAIAILIIFAVMLTRGMTALPQVYNRQQWLGVGVAILAFAALLVGVILPVWGPEGSTVVNAPAQVTTTLDLGVALVDKNQYVLPFEVASLLLTAAMIGAIAIARDDESGE